MINISQGRCFPVLAKVELLLPRCQQAGSNKGTASWSHRFWANQNGCYDAGAFSRQRNTSPAVLDPVTANSWTFRHECSPESTFLCRASGPHCWVPFRERHQKEGPSLAFDRRPWEELQTEKSVLKVPCALFDWQVLPWWIAGPFTKSNEQRSVDTKMLRLLQEQFATVFRALDGGWQVTVYGHVERRE